MKHIIVIAAALLVTACAGTGGIVSNVPAKPDPTAKYIFYLHGSVEESKGATDKYQAAIDAIAVGSATVISEVRGPTEPKAYSLKLKNQVDNLISNGVPAENITISGFSKGAIIALGAASTINHHMVNYVLLAGCSDFLNEKYGVDPAKAKGRILSIYDSSDDKFGSCEGILQSGDGLVVDEIELDSGKGHKLFRIPKEKFIRQWRDPLLRWADA